jgi:hypothetical protein
MPQAAVGRSQALWTKAIPPDLSSDIRRRSASCSTPSSPYCVQQRAHSRARQASCWSLRSNTRLSDARGPCEGPFPAPRKRLVHAALALGRTIVPVAGPLVEQVACLASSRRYPWEARDAHRRGYRHASPRRVRPCLEEITPCGPSTVSAPRRTLDNAFEAGFRTLAFFHTPADTRPDRPGMPGRQALHPALPPAAPAHDCTAGWVAKA